MISKFVTFKKVLDFVGYCLQNLYFVGLVWDLRWLVPDFLHFNHFYPKHFCIIGLHATFFQAIFSSHYFKANSKTIERLCKVCLSLGEVYFVISALNVVSCCAVICEHCVRTEPCPRLYVRHDSTIVSLHFCILFQTSYVKRTVDRLVFKFYQRESIDEKVFNTRITFVSACFTNPSASRQGQKSRRGESLCPFQLFTQTKRKWENSMEHWV